MYNVSIKIKEFLHWSRNEETHNHEKTRKSGSLLVEKVWFQNIFMDLQKLTPDNTQTHDCTRLYPIGLFKRNHIKQYCGNVISSTLQGLEKPSWPKVFRGVLPWEMLDGEDLDQVILNDMFLSCVFFVMPKNGLFKVLVSF